MGKVHPGVLAAAVGLLVLTAWCLPRRTSWKHLPEAALDDKPRLLILAATETEPMEVRLQAVRRLLWKTRRPSVPKGTGIDHPMVSLEDDGPKDHFDFVVTLSEEPDLPGRHPWFWQQKLKSDYEDYWSMDRLAFDRTGRLLYWGPYR